jgi:hypothetical protein
MKTNSLSILCSSLSRLADLMTAVRWGVSESGGLYQPSESTAALVLLLFQQHCRQQGGFKPLSREDLASLEVLLVVWRADYLCEPEHRSLSLTLFRLSQQLFLRHKQIAIQLAIISQLLATHTWQHHPPLPSKQSGE